MVWLNLRQIRLLEFDFLKKVKVQLTGPTLERMWKLFPESKQYIRIFHSMIISRLHISARTLSRWLETLSSAPRPQPQPAPAPQSLRLC